jgi:hypothetical protein
MDLMANDVEDTMADMDGPLVLRSKLSVGEIEPLPENIPIETLAMIDEIERWSRFRATQIAVRIQQEIQ